LAGILLKLGTYGMLRILIPFFPLMTEYLSSFIFMFALLGIIYSSVVTIRQIDLKKIIAYSSVVHMNFSLLGLFSLNFFAIVGSIFLMLSHGLVSGGLFFYIGSLYNRYKTRILTYYGGLVQVMPLFTICFFIISFANIGLPGTSSFVGEILTLVGIIYEGFFFVALLGTSSILLGAVYGL
jgi:NADH:ubiquinone oxidoreductase subunit 4 (subunit M)